ncbi:ankyrin repeat-containing domain protein [Tuber indicum]|nr:ankyrin repeat-containing domain protein [Tuber indicum]
MPFLDLPNEIIFHIAEVLCLRDQYSLLRTNRRLAALLPDALIDRVFLFRYDMFARKALYSAAGREDKAMVKKLLDKGILDFIGRSGLLNAAIKTENETVIRVLLECGVDPETGGKRTPLVEAAESGQANMVQLFVGRDNVDVNSQDVLDRKTALCYAASRGHHEVAQVLLSDGRTERNFRTEEDWTPLHLAASRGHHLVVEVLLSDTRTDANARDRESWTPLQVAANRGYEMVVKTLLDDERVDINAKDNFGWTALHSAAAGGHRTTMRILLEDDKLDDELREVYGGQYYTRWTTGDIKRRCCIS